ncbi:MAG: IS5 family transposase [Acidimicrobiales bacterium]|nr:IS5 family transposase [Rhodothermaceae bacterium]MYI13474.1 IS5 family transposase [Acidimicrobiales bacterium]
MEDVLYDNVAVHVFARVEAGHALDETTTCKFRHLLEEHDLTRLLFELSRDILNQRGLLVKAGTIVDATIISAPSPTKSQAKQRDPEMKSTNRQWYFGMKAHIGTDTPGLVHGVAVTPANAQDVTLMDNCLHGQEEVIYGDTAHVSDQRRAQVQARGMQWHVLRKATRTRKLPCADQSFNKKSNRTRSRVEHTFGVIKHLWGYCKTRYRGLDKNAARVYTRANFYLARDSLLATMTAG